MSKEKNTHFIQAYNLNFMRGERRIISDLNFRVESGMFFNIIGTNGSGKTSLLRLIAGLLQPVSGKIEKSTSRCHYIGHEAGLRRDLRVLETLQFWQDLMCTEKNKVCLESVLEKADLSVFSNVYLRDLSQGQYQRVGLCRLLAIRNPIWLLDEPFTALDEQYRIWLMNIVEIHLSQGGLVIAASHNHLDCQTDSITLGNL